MPTLGVNWDKGDCARTAPSLSGGNEEADPAAEYKAGLRETDTGESRRGVPSLQGCLPECVGEKYGDHQLLHGSKTKGRDQPAAGGDTHLSRIHAGSFPENAEVGRQTTTPRRLRIYPPTTPRCRCGGSAGSTSLGQAKPTTPSEPRGDVTRSAHRPSSAPRQPGPLPSAPAQEVEQCLVSLCSWAPSTVLFSKDGVDVFQIACFLGNMIEFVVRMGRLRGGGEKGGLRKRQVTRALDRFRGDTARAVARAPAAGQLRAFAERIGSGLQFSTRALGSGRGSGERLCAGVGL